MAEIININKFRTKIKKSAIEVDYEATYQKAVLSYNRLLRVIYYKKIDDVQLREDDIDMAVAMIKILGCIIGYPQEVIERDINEVLNDRN